MGDPVVEAIRSWSGDAGPVTVAASLGLERATNSRKHWRCPRHGGGSLSLTVGPDGSLRARCFGCDLAGDVFNLAGEVIGGSFVDAKRWLAELAGVAIDMKGELRTIAARPPAPAPCYPPQHEVEAVWHSCLPVTSNDAVTRYLTSRGIDPSVLWSRNLARVLTAATPSCAWSSFGERSWFAAGFVIVVPVFDAHGAMRSLRAWHPSPPTGAPKRIAPKGCSTKGLVMACGPLGQAMLAGEHAPERVVVCEGEPDFLVWATRGHLLDDRRWATLGVEAGAWTSEIAARIPAGAIVTVATDHDDAGERYAATVAATLAGRCELRRSLPATEIAS